MAEDTDAARCQSIFINLLRFGGEAHKRPAVYIRELDQTSRCDRQGVGPRNASTVTDVRSATQAVMHNYHTTERNLVSALSWPNWPRCIAPCTI